MFPFRSSQPWPSNCNWERRSVLLLDTSTQLGQLLREIGKDCWQRRCNPIGLLQEEGSQSCLGVGQPLLFGLQLYLCWRQCLLSPRNFFVTSEDPLLRPFDEHLRRRDSCLRRDVLGPALWLSSKRPCNPAYVGRTRRLLPLLPPIWSRVPLALESTSSGGGARWTPWTCWPTWESRRTVSQTFTLDFGWPFIDHFADCGRGPRMSCNQPSVRDLNGAPSFARQVTASYLRCEKN